MISWFARWRERHVRPSSSLQIEGACKMSGQCCRSLILVHGGDPVNSHVGFTRMCASDPEARMFVPRETVSADGLLRFGCRNLGPDSRCQIYESRPEMCREYPAPAMFERGGSLLNGCGYRVVNRSPNHEPFEDVLDAVLEPRRAGLSEEIAARSPEDSDASPDPEGHTL